MCLHFRCLTTRQLTNLIIMLNWMTIAGYCWSWAVKYLMRIFPPLPEGYQIPHGGILKAKRLLERELYKDFFPAAFALAHLALAAAAIFAFAATLILRFALTRFANDFDFIFDQRTF